MTLKKPTIRVYGLVRDSNGRILLSDEVYRDRSFVKFPGGGWELGEAPIDTVRREFQEEVGWTVTVESLVHITEQAIVSSFDESKQVLAIYYLVQYESFMDQLPKASDEERFFWCDAEAVLDHLTFDTDREAFAKWQSEQI